VFPVKETLCNSIQNVVNIYLGGVLATLPNCPTLKESGYFHSRIDPSVLLIEHLVLVGL